MSVAPHIIPLLVLVFVMETLSVVDDYRVYCFSPHGDENTGSHTQVRETNHTTKASYPNFTVKIPSMPHPHS